MKCFVVVYQSLSEFFIRRDFHQGGAQEETKKISKRKKRQHKRDERAKKKQRRDSRFYERQQNTHTFEARDKFFLRENKRNFLLLFRNALTY